MKSNVRPKGASVRKGKRGEGKAQYLSITAHDLRNPISAILSASECLLEDFSDAREDHVALLQAIYSSSRLILQLIDDVLEISKMDSGMLEFRLQPTDIVSLVKQNLVLNRPAAERKRVHLDLIAGGEAPPLLIDPQKIYQVIDKLITNAIKFSYPDTRIEIRVGVEGESVTLSVRDHGPGIPAREQRAILSPLRKSRSRTASRTEVNPGLAVITRIIEGHGGNVKLESRLGQGSTFSVSLPLKNSLPDSPAT